MPSSGPLDTTIRRVFAVASNRCAFQGCTTPIIDPTSNTILAEVCHIKARNLRGPRFDPSQTDEERHGFDNLVLMCGAHHKLIDAPENAHLHTVESLMELKAQHESEARAGGRRATTLSAEQIAVLLESSTRYEDWSIHNDFRQALFKVGGEGGGLGGGGGGGGILTLVGTNRAPASVELDGQAGRAPGAGGGGGGATVFIGRPIDSDDLAVGLRLSSLFLANYGNYSDTLLNVLGAGWSNLLLQTLPCSVKLLLALVLDLGEVEPSTLLRLKVQVVAPSGSQATEQVADIAVPDSVDLVKRATRLVLLDFDIAEFGKWTIEVHSSAHRLGIYEFECRHSIQHQ